MNFSNTTPRANISRLLEFARRNRNFSPTGPLIHNDINELDYIPFELEPRNLNEDFEKMSLNNNKYNISTIILVEEELEKFEEFDECLICFEETKLSNIVKINCGHTCCRTCIKKTLHMYNNLKDSPSCAFCRTLITSFTVKNTETYDVIWGQNHD